MCVLQCEALELDMLQEIPLCGCVDTQGLHGNVSGPGQFDLQYLRLTVLLLIFYRTFQYNFTVLSAIILLVETCQ